MSKIYGYGECGCLYPVPSKEEFDNLAATSGVSYRETVTVTSAGQTMVQLSNDLFTKKCLVEVYGIKNVNGTPFFAGATVCIPVKDVYGTKIDVVVKISVLTEGNSYIKLCDELGEEVKNVLTGETAVPLANALSSVERTLDITLTNELQNIIEVPTNCMVYVDLSIGGATTQLTILLKGDVAGYYKTLSCEITEDGDRRVTLYYEKTSDYLKMKYSYYSAYALPVKVKKVTIINLNKPYVSYNGSYTVNE